MNFKKITAMAGAMILSLSIMTGSFAYAADSATVSPAPSASTASPAPKGGNTKNEFNLEDYAKKLGIDTANMTEDQIKAAVKEQKLQKAKGFLIEKGLYKEGMTEKEIFKKVREYHKSNPK